MVSTGRDEICLCAVEGISHTCHSSWSFGRSSYATDVEASGLGGEVRASSYRAHFYGRHGDTHVQTLAVL